MQGAMRYQLQFTLPSGQPVTFDTESTNSTRYIESFLAGGTYTWQVVAYDPTGREICAAEPFTFEKPESTPPTEEDNNGDNNNGNDTSDGINIQDISNQ